MSQPLLTINPGVSINPGVTLNAFAASAPPPGSSITVNITDLTSSGIENGSWTFPDPYFTINAAIGTGVAFDFNPSSSILAEFANNPNNNGYVWSAQWATGSTTINTNVAMFVGQFGSSSVVFFMLDPADSTHATGLAGTFRFPVTFTSSSVYDNSPTPG